MKRVIFCLLALFLASFVSSQTPKTTSSEQTSTEKYIRESEAQWAESAATGDTTVIERILADEFVGIDPKGNFYKKAQLISDTRGTPKYFASNHLDNVNIRFFGDTAVAQGSETWERANGKRGRFVWTDTWVRRYGRWQIVAAEDLIAEPLPAKGSSQR
jgi:hypothetical protein